MVPCFLQISQIWMKQHLKSEYRSDRIQPFATDSFRFYRRRKRGWKKNCFVPSGISNIPLHNPLVIFYTILDKVDQFFLLKWSLSSKNKLGIIPILCSIKLSGRSVKFILRLRFAMSHSNLLTRILLFQKLAALFWIIISSRIATME